MAVIEVKNLVKKFKDEVVVKNLSFSVHENQVFGLLGSNGAGKTTTINILTGLLIQDSGSVRILGFDSKKDIEKIRQNIALVPQTTSLYQNLTIYENLEFFGMLYIGNRKVLKMKINEMIKFFQLEGRENIKISKLSGGYQRRCSIGCALISSPKILFLDEPLTGIDLQTSKLILNFIKSVKEMAIIFTTHSIKDAETICDNIIFMDNGEKILEGSPNQIIKHYSRYLGEQIIIEFDKPIHSHFIQRTLEARGYDINNIRVYNNTIHFFCTDLGKKVVHFLESLKFLHSHILNVEIKKPSLENILDFLMEYRK